jgi:hypothetical protein
MAERLPAGLSAVPATRVRTISTMDRAWAPAGCIANARKNRHPRSMSLATERRDAMR